MYNLFNSVYDMLSQGSSCTFYKEFDCTPPEKRPGNYVTLGIKSIKILDNYNGFAKGEAVFRASVFGTEHCDNSLLYNIFDLSVTNKIVYEDVILKDISTKPVVMNYDIGRLELYGEFTVEFICSWRNETE